MHRLAFRILLALASWVALALGRAPTVAVARPAERFYVILGKSEARTQVPAALLTATDTTLEIALKKHPRFVRELPNAPDPQKHPDAFKTYLAKQHLRAFTLRAKIERFDRAEEPAKSGKSGHVLKIGVALSLLGESVPDKTLAMSGEGSATVGLEIGKNVRPRDEQAATQEALESALAGALTQFVQKLDARPRAKPQKQ